MKGARRDGMETMSMTDEEIAAYRAARRQNEVV